MTALFINILGTFYLLAMLAGGFAGLYLAFRGER